MVPALLRGGLLAGALLASTGALACGASGTAGPTASASGLFGVVRRGPVVPVCRVGQPCDEPTKAVLIFSRNGREIARTRSRADGTYRIRLAPGAYAVRLPGPPAAIGSGLAPKRVTVARGRYRHVDFSIDTGIR